MMEVQKTQQKPAEHALIYIIPWNLDSRSLAFDANDSVVLPKIFES